VRPEWILAQDGCGPKTLEYIRLMLAVKDLTLKDDKTPEHWRSNRDNARIMEVLGNELIDDDDGQPAAKDRGVMCPFVVLIDSAENHPYTFAGLRTDAAEGNRPLIVPTEFVALGRHPLGLGDYSLDAPGVGGRGRCHVERKSMQDAHSTILGWAKKGEDCGRRERFERELEQLSEIEAGLVVVECSFDRLIAQAPCYGQRSAALNAKTLHRSVLAFMADYSCPWIFADDRRMAEKTVFHWLRRWAEKATAELKAERKRAAAAVKQREKAEQPKQRDFEMELAGL